MQPRRQVLAVLDAVLRRQREQANELSTTTARLAQIVQAAASMGKVSSGEEVFLPYLKEADRDRPRLRADVAATLRTLIRQRALPMPIMAFLMEDLKTAGPTS